MVDLPTPTFWRVWVAKVAPSRTADPWKLQASGSSAGDQAAVRRACSLTVEKGRVRVPRLHSLRQSRLSMLALYGDFLSHTLLLEMVDQRAQHRGDLSPARVE